jgi:serine/threonine-protein kinase PRP4
LRDADPQNNKHVVRLMSHFTHKDHLCLVFNAAHLNLRQVIKKFGGVGLSLPAVKAYARQMFCGLHHLKACGILHGDLKPGR